MKCLHHEFAGTYLPVLRAGRAKISSDFGAAVKRALFEDYFGGHFVFAFSGFNRFKAGATRF
jgi:hypothetical protein